MDANRESARPVGLNGRAWLQQWWLPKREKCTASCGLPLKFQPRNREPDPTTGKGLTHARV
jgi:hypothetical protein